eukprot:3079422-Lingulodinium_polyedra.AAC.1
MLRGRAANEADLVFPLAMAGLPERGRRLVRGLADRPKAGRIAAGRLVHLSGRRGLWRRPPRPNAACDA